MKFEVKGMGKYETKKSKESSLPVGGETLYKTEIKNKETGDKSTGYGWDRDTADKKARKGMVK
jgi:hypothetical protein